MTFLSQLLPGLSSGPMLRVLGALLILVFGHLLVKLVKVFIRRFWIRGAEDVTKKDIERREENIRLAGYILDGAVISGAILYLNAGIGQSFFSNLVSSSPRIASALLLGVLGVVLIRIVTRVFRDFLSTVGVNNYLRELGLSRSASNLIAAAAKALMYVILFQVVLAQLQIGYTFLNQLLNAATWAFAFMVAALTFYSLKDLFHNIAAGFYLKNSHLVRQGEEVKVDGETGEIKEISLFSTSVNTDSGYTLLTPNSQLMESPMRVKRTQSDLETLEDITSYFVAQDPSYCGPASAEMALEIFGYRHDQHEIGEKADVQEGEGVEEEDLMEAIEELTNNEVRTAWVGYDKITDLEDEYKSWFNDGALIVSNFYKPEIFPDASAGHFVLSVGVEGEEILNLDPSGTNGGVYYVNNDTLYDAMADFGHERGYIVVAPKGTTAYWRIKNDLIYGDKSLYDELSKTLESRLRKILRKGRILKNSTPESMENYMEEWTAEEKLTRVWKPEGFSGEKEKPEGDEDEASEDN
ncbi:MAG: mechanosensitive ion channel domain-containing protein [Candidatus Nanohalobium sp.]